MHDEFIEFMRSALNLKQVSETTQIQHICPGKINQGGLGGKIKERYGVNLTNTEISRCQTVADLKRTIERQKVKNQQARDNGRCTISLQRERMLNIH